MSNVTMAEVEREELTSSCAPTSETQEDVTPGGMGVPFAEEGGRPTRVRRWTERGMVSAEWAVGIIAAIAIAGVLLAVVTTGTVKQALLAFIIQVIGAFADNL